MAQNLVDNFTTQYDSKVKTIYQAHMKLKGTTRVEMVKGDKHRFPVINEGVTQEANPGAELNYGENDDASVEVSVRDWESPLLIPVQHQNKVAYNPKDEYSKKTGMAIGRKCDQITIDAVDAGAHTKMTIDVDFGDQEENPGGLTFDKIRRTAALMNAAGVPMSDRHFVISASGLEDLLDITKYTSSDFTDLKPLRKGEVVPFMGFEFHVMSEFDRSLTGLKKGATSGAGANRKQVRNYLAYHKDAVGTVINEDIASRVDFLAHRMSWQAYTSYSAGAGTIDQRGVVKILVNENLLDIPTLSEFTNTRNA